MRKLSIIFVVFIFVFDAGAQVDESAFPHCAERVENRPVTVDWATALTNCLNGLPDQYADHVEMMRPSVAERTTRSESPSMANNRSSSTKSFDFETIYNDLENVSTKCAVASLTPECSQAAKIYSNAAITLAVRSLTAAYSVAGVGIAEPTLGRYFMMTTMQDGLELGLLQPAAELGVLLAASGDNNNLVNKAAQVYIDDVFVHATASLVFQKGEWQKFIQLENFGLYPKMENRNASVFTMDFFEVVKYSYNEFGRIEISSIGISNRAYVASMPEFVKLEIDTEAPPNSLDYLEILPSGVVGRNLETNSQISDRLREFFTRNSFSESEYQFNLRHGQNMESISTGSSRSLILAQCEFECRDKSIPEMRDIVSESVEARYTGMINSVAKKLSDIKTNPMYSVVSSANSARKFRKKTQDLVHNHSMCLDVCAREAKQLAEEREVQMKYNESKTALRQKENQLDEIARRINENTVNISKLVSENDRLRDKIDEARENNEEYDEDEELRIQNMEEIIRNNEEKFQEANELGKRLERENREKNIEYKEAKDSEDAARAELERKRAERKKENASQTGVNSESIMVDQYECERNEGFGCRRLCERFPDPTLPFSEALCDGTEAEIRHELVVRVLFDGPCATMTPAPGFECVVDPETLEPKIVPTGNSQDQWLYADDVCATVTTPFPTICVPNGSGGYRIVDPTVPLQTSSLEAPDQRRHWCDYALTDDPELCGFGIEVLDYLLPADPLVPTALK